jgi:hypothetical protein
MWVAVGCTFDIHTNFIVDSLKVDVCPDVALPVNIKHMEHL